jgi:hypothetical protein
MTLSFGGLEVPPCWRAYFLLLRKKKVAKEKAPPGSAPLWGSLRYSASRSACQNSPAAQTRQADFPRHACVAQHLSRGPKASWLNRFDQKLHSHGQPEKNPKNEIHWSLVDALPGPLRGAEQRRLARKKGEHCLRAKPELRSPRVCRVAQGTGEAGTDPGSPSFCLLFLGEARKSETPSKGGTPSQSKPISLDKRYQPC